MVLAEALLRVPDADTADRLIEDKLKAGDWAHHDPLDRAAGVGLGLDARHHGARHPSGRDAGGHRRGAGQAARPAGGARRHPPGHAAARLAFRARSDHRGGAGARRFAAREFLYSFDMLGEGARTAADAERYFDSYANAIDAIGKSAGNAALPKRQTGGFGISVKLSALHPRYEPLSRERVLKELVAETARAGAAGKKSRAQFHRRCRRGRPAGIVARGDRRGAARSFAGRLGRLRPRGAGLSEARRLR